MTPFTAGPLGLLRPALANVMVRRPHPVSNPIELPRRVNGGWWRTSHVQGVAADLERRHLYFSFTTLLVKTDLAGVLLGTVEGFTGHLGDVTFNPADRRLYAFLEYKAAAAFYVAVVDVDAIDRQGIRAGDADVVRTVHLAEVTADYAADSTGTAISTATARTPRTTATDAAASTGSASVPGSARRPNRRSSSPSRTALTRTCAGTTTTTRCCSSTASTAGTPCPGPSTRMCRTAADRLRRTASTSSAPATRGSGCRTWSTTRRSSAGSSACTRGRSRRSRTTRSSRSTPRWNRAGAAARRAGAARAAAPPG
jgi:hypothetical protein